MYRLKRGFKILQNKHGFISLEQLFEKEKYLFECLEINFEKEVDKLIQNIKEGKEISKKFYESEKEFFTNFGGSKYTLSYMEEYAQNIKVYEKFLVLLENKETFIEAVKAEIISNRKEIKKQLDM